MMDDLPHPHAAWHDVERVRTERRDRLAKLIAEIYADNDSAQPEGYDYRTADRLVDACSDHVRRNN